jgi:hypothetical protein
VILSDYTFCNYSYVGSCNILKLEIKTIIRSRFPAELPSNYSKVFLIVRQIIRIRKRTLVGEGNLLYKVRFSVFYERH